MGELQPKAMMGMFQRAAEAPPQTNGLQAEKAIAEILGGKKEPSLGDLNPLIHIPDLLNRDSINALKLVTLEKIRKYDGIVPTRLESAVATSLDERNAALRFVARFEVDNITEKQMVQLEDAVRETYDTTVRTRTGNDGKDIHMESYPRLNNGDLVEAHTRGWYMGPILSTTDSLHQGLFLFKDFGKTTKDNFLEKEPQPVKYIVEVREAALYQTDLVQFVSRVSAILGNKDIPPEGDLLYEIYYDLIRLGLKKADASTVYGMDDAIKQVKRGLLTPLASPDLSSGVSQVPESVLMVGVYGTGKTLVVEQLLHEETGVLILPLDPKELANELQQPKEKQRLLPRIANVASKTGKKIVLQIDDIENMIEVAKLNQTNSTLLNLMAGIRDSGFYIWASTNYPEKLDPQILQPGRFGTLVYTGLQDAHARREILKIHATPQSARLGADLFSSPEARDIILDELAKHTEGFTPRYLMQISKKAKSVLMERVAQREHTTIGLTEENLQGETFTLDDWEEAFREVSAQYDRKEIETRDKELKDFVIKHAHVRLGFSNGEHGPTSIFSADAHRKFKEIQNRTSNTKSD